MKTIKILKKVNIIFVIAIILMAISTAVFSQGSPRWERGCAYGSASLVEFIPVFYLDSSAVSFKVDENFVEFVSIAYPTVDEDESTVRVDNVKASQVEVGDEIVQTFYPSTYAYVKTKNGVTAFYYLWIESKKTGLLAINGKIIARYDYATRVITDDLMVSEDLFVSGGVDWAYSTGRK